MKTLLSGKTLTGARASPVLLSMLSVHSSLAPGQVDQAWPPQGAEFRKTLSLIDGAATMCVPNMADPDASVVNGVSYPIEAAEEQLAAFQKKMANHEARVQDYAETLEFLACKTNATQQEDQNKLTAHLHELRRLLTYAAIVDGDQTQLAEKVAQRGRITAYNANHHACLSDFGRSPYYPGAYTKGVLDEQRNALRNKLFDPPADLSAHFVAGALVNSNEYDATVSTENPNIFKSLFNHDDIILPLKEFPFAWDGTDSATTHLSQGLAALRVIRNRLVPDFYEEQIKPENLRSNGCVARESGFEDCTHHVYAHLAKHLIKSAGELYDSETHRAQGSCEITEGRGCMPLVAANHWTYRQLLRTERDLALRFLADPEPYKRLWERDIGPLRHCDGYLMTHVYDDEDRDSDLKMHPNNAAQLILVDQFLSWQIPRLTEYIERHKTPEEFLLFKELIEQLDPIGANDPYHSVNTGRPPLVKDYRRVVAAVEAVISQMSLDTQTEDKPEQQSILIPTDLQRSPIDSKDDFSASLRAVGKAAAARTLLLSSGRKEAQSVLLDELVQPIALTSDLSIHTKSFSKDLPDLLVRLREEKRITEEL